MRRQYSLTMAAMAVIILFMWIIRQRSLYNLDTPLNSKQTGKDEEIKDDSRIVNLHSNSQTYSIPRGRPKILYWAKPHHSIDWTFPRLQNGDGGCDITLDRSQLYDTDAVLFVMKSCRKKDLPPPQSRRPNQTYIWYVRESPWTVRHYYKQNLDQYKEYFNWTMSYRMDSDIVAAMWPTPAMDFVFQTVGRTEDMVDSKLSQKAHLQLNDYRRQIQSLLEKKNQLLAWIVSNCKTTAGAKQRSTVTDELESTGLKVVKFGKCGGEPLPFNLTALFETMSHFKFYLAFENSFHCKDYITEKVFYNSFVSGSVPIIHGPRKEDVEKLLPKKSYIFLEDFRSMNDLKDYLLYLDKNNTAYSEYFQWWMTPGAQLVPRYGFNYGAHYIQRVPQLPEFSKLDVQDNWLENQRFALYHLCRRLKRGDHLRNSYVVKDLGAYWFGRDSHECVNP